MTKYKNYRNKYTKNNVIHTIDNIVKMPFGNVVQREKEFSSQYNQIGFPTDKDMRNSSNVVYVEEYTRSDGTVVHAHWRSKPEGTSNNGNISEQSQSNNTPQKTSEPSPVEENTQSEQSEINANLTDYINDFIGENIDYGFIGNKASTSSQPEIPIYPENGMIKGGIANDSESNKDILQQSGGYIYPDKKSRDYNIIDESAIKYNNKKNTNRPDAKQMLEIGIYGVDSYDDNDQFKHIQDGSADLYNEKYNLTGNKTIPSDMKGIEFSKDSDFSKRISKNVDFQQAVKDAFEKNGGKMPDKIELDFSKDKNLNYSIGHGTLLNPKITDDGYIEGIVYDKYDYKYEYLNTPETTYYNTGAAGLHDIKRLEYYYYFVPVRFKY